MTGTWQGTLEAGPVKLRLGLHITRNTVGLPVKLTEIEDNALYLELPNLHATFAGVLSADGRQIQGVLTQGVPLPLTFLRPTRRNPSTAAGTQAAVPV